MSDTTQCKTGRTDCVAACNRENGLSGGTKAPELSPTSSQWIRKVELKDMRSGRELSVPMMCQHCEHPPCVAVCPTTASFKRADGIVLVDKHRCIGCRYCMMACPYKARAAGLLRLRTAGLTASANCWCAMKSWNAVLSA